MNRTEDSMYLQSNNRLYVGYDSNSLMQLVDMPQGEILVSLVVIEPRKA